MDQWTGRSDLHRAAQHQRPELSVLFADRLYATVHAPSNDDLTDILRRSGLGYGAGCKRNRRAAVPHLVPERNRDRGRTETGHNRLERGVENYPGDRRRSGRRAEERAIYGGLRRRAAEYRREQIRMVRIAADRQWTACRRCCIST